MIALTVLVVLAGLIPAFLVVAALMQPPDPLDKWALLIGMLLIVGIALCATHVQQQLRQVQSVEACEKETK